MVVDTLMAVLNITRIFNSNKIHFAALKFKKLKVTEFTFFNKWSTFSGGLKPYTDK